MWWVAPTGGRPTSRDDVDRARPSFNEERDEFYIDRYQELRQADLAFVAARLARVFAESNRRSRAAIEDAIRSALEREGRTLDAGAVTAACDRLQDLEYIWSAIHESRHRFEPGIPSLMRFTARSEGLEVGRGSLSA